MDCLFAISPINVFPDRLYSKIKMKCAQMDVMKIM